MESLRGATTVVPHRRSIGASLGLIVLAWCPALGIAAEARPNLQGVWVQTSTTVDDPRWRLEDLLCGTPGDCTTAAMEYTKTLLSDPKNDDRPLIELDRLSKDYNRKFLQEHLTEAALKAQAVHRLADEGVNRCIPSGYFRGPAPLPIKIEQSDDRVILRYEFWNATRTIYMNGAADPAGTAPSLMGHSVGWYDGPTLVIVTTGIKSDVIGSVSIDGVQSSDRATGIERYTVTEGGSRLQLEWTIIDPVTLKRPLQMTRGFLSAPPRAFNFEEPCERKSWE